MSIDYGDLLPMFLKMWETIVNFFALADSFLREVPPSLVFFIMVLFGMSAYILSYKMGKVIEDNIEQRKTINDLRKKLKVRENELSYQKELLDLSKVEKCSKSIDDNRRSIVADAKVKKGFLTSLKGGYHECRSFLLKGLVWSGLISKT